MLREIILLHVLPRMFCDMKGAHEKKLYKSMQQKKTLSSFPYLVPYLDLIGHAHIEYMQKYTNNNIALKHKPQ